MSICFRNTLHSPAYCHYIPLNAVQNHSGAWGKRKYLILFLPYIRMLIFCSSWIFALILIFQNIAQKYDYLDSWDFLCAKVLQLWPTLCDPMDYNLPGSSIRGILQTRILSCHILLQGFFPTQGSNPSLLQLLRCKWILYCWATGKATSP